MTPYTLALELTLILAAWLAIGSWQRQDQVPGRLTFAAASMAVVFWVAGELILVRGETPLLARRVSTIGVLALTPLWFGVAAHSVKLSVISSISSSTGSMRRCLNQRAARQMT